MTGHIVNRREARLVVMETADPLPAAIQQYDALTLTGSNEVIQGSSEGEGFVGIAFEPQDTAGQTIAVYVQGIVTAKWTGNAPPLDGQTGGEISDTPGALRNPGIGSGIGTVLSHDPVAETVQIRI